MLLILLLLYDLFAGGCVGWAGRQERGVVPHENELCVRQRNVRSLRPTTSRRCTCLLSPVQPFLKKKIVVGFFGCCETCKVALEHVGRATIGQLY